MKKEPTMKINKLLIVDDEKPISSYLNRKLSKLGYTVYIAEDGEEALEQAFAHLPDLILLDVKLPKLDGLSVCQRLKSDPRTDKIPVVILSAKAQSEEVRAGMAAGADQYLCKPLGFPDILQEIKRFEAR
jgi:CheY-like chemotaxis protein